MGFGSSDLEEKIELLKLKNELAQQELSLAKTKAIKKQIKKKYGKNWRSMIGAGGKHGDNDTLAQFANVGKKMSDIGGARRLPQTSSPSPVRSVPSVNK